MKTVVPRAAMGWATVLSSAKNGYYESLFGLIIGIVKWKILLTLLDVKLEKLDLITNFSVR